MLRPISSLSSASRPSRHISRHISNSSIDAQTPKQKPVLPAFPSPQRPCLSRQKVDGEYDNVLRDQEVTPTSQMMRECSQYGGINYFIHVVTLSQLNEMKSVYSSSRVNYTLSSFITQLLTLRLTPLFRLQENTWKSIALIPHKALSSQIQASAFLLFKAPTLMNTSTAWVHMPPSRGSNKPNLLFLSNFHLNQSTGIYAAVGHNILICLMGLVTVNPSTFQCTTGNLRKCSYST